MHTPMQTTIAAKLVQGLHPGLLVSRELKKRDLTIETFSGQLGEGPDIILAILTGKKELETNLADKIEKLFGWLPGFLMEMQAKAAKPKVISEASFLWEMRKALFWDTDIRLIDPEKHRKAVILRVFTKGNDREKQLTLEYYGQATVKNILQTLTVNC